MIKLKCAYNVRYENEEKTQITMTIELDESDLIDAPVDFTTTATDTTDYGRVWFHRARLGEFGPIKQYEPFTPSEEALLNTKWEEFGSEKEIALKIDVDYRLELADISDEQMREVKDYIRAIKPDAVTRSIPIRPEIMNQYSQLNTTLEE